MQTNTMDLFQPSHSNGVFSLPIRVYNHDIDAGRVVFVANYLKFMERARTEWLHAIGVDQRHLERELRAGFVIRDVQVQCLKPAYLDDLVVATVQIEDLGLSSITMRQTVVRGESLLCTAKITAVCINVVKFRPVQIPKGIRLRFALEQQRVVDHSPQGERPGALTAVRS